MAGRKESLEPYSGVDVRVYRIPQPIDFLKKQKNLHRPSLKANYGGEGLSNTLNYLWDSWFKKSRLAWQRVFSFFVRKGVVEHAPELKQFPPHAYQTRFENNPQFKPIEGLDVVDQYRYPLWHSKPIAPPAGVSLRGSSSNFLELKQGNIYIPVGKRNPGLYLVEAMIGTFRATTFLFVSDTVAVTKLSSRQELVWTVERGTGRPVAETKLLFTDGIGTLGEGRTGRDGVFVLEGKSLERSYVLGQDRSGGVFVSENFYFDSEIYGTKLYVFTDRPLYRPGDLVNVKLLGREFKSAGHSVPISTTPASVTVLDSEGTPIVNKRMEISSGIFGGDVSFRLPEFARAGGYSLQVQYKQANYLSAFRVANYVKPHFEIEIGFDRPEVKVNESAKGKVKLTYPNGDPVKAGRVEVEIRKQKLTIVEGELQYLDRFPVQVSKEPFVASDAGIVDFDVPPAAEPSRYVISVRAVDGGAFRVTTTKELLVQTSSSPLLLTSARNFSMPGEKVVFRVAPGGAESGVSRKETGSWEVIRLQDRSTFQGELSESQNEITVGFDRPGSYMISIKDKQGGILASANHWVQGPELATLPGTVSIILDKNEYEVGETASALITFSEEIGDALVTLERDKVERHALVSGGGDWIRLKRVSGREYKGEIPIKEGFEPNITLSVAYAGNGRYFFENKGIKVTTPKIQIIFKPDKKTYQPGETVTVAVETRFREKPVEASLSIGVVDEMIYVLQPEIAPEISDFFFHVRRNQVRTTSSLSFHSYDAASSATGAKASLSTQYSERSLKLRERPRREEKDTAYWEPALKTDAAGKAMFSFVMPDSLTRWRITGRAIASNGQVGQRRDFVVSQKDAYLKWTGPTSFRKGDLAQVGITLFNMTQADRNVAFEASGTGASSSQKIMLRPGSNHLVLPVSAEMSGDVTLVIKEGVKVLDELKVRLAISPIAWASTASRKVGPSSRDVPPGAFNIRVHSASGVNEVFFRAVDYLADYPYGCVEQTSSRLLPLALVFSSLEQLGSSEAVRERLQNRLISERLRLVKMAGPEARFSWWGDQTAQSAFMTAYAYFADWYATKALGVNISSEHWEHLLKAYSQFAEFEPMMNKVAILWMAAEMGLPIRTLAEGVLESAKTGADGAGSLFAANSAGESLASAILLEVVSRKAGLSMPGPLAARSGEAKRRALDSGSALAQSAYLLGKEGTELGPEDIALAERVLDSLTVEVPTIERGLALAFLHRALGSRLKPAPSVGVPEPGKGWLKIESKLGRAVWQYRGSAPLKKLPETFVQPGSSFHMIYEIFGREASTLSVGIERKLSRLTQGSDPLEFGMSPLAGEWTLDSKEVYLDEITITPQGNEIYQFGLVEAPLPPGADVEQTIWGMTLKGVAGETLQVGNSSFQAGDRSYSVAIEKLDKPVTIRQLVRFSQPGRFELPPARFFRMYSPVQKSFEGGDSFANRKILVR